MSIRTIIEINHDCLGDYERHPEYWRNLEMKLGSGMWGENVTRAFPTPGIRVLGQRHHTESLTVTAE